MMSVDRGLDGLDGGRSRYDAAFRPRGRRLRMHWRHEQLSIRRTVESAVHHSFQQPHLVRACTQTMTFTDAATCAATSTSVPRDRIRGTRCPPSFPPGITSLSRWNEKLIEFLCCKGIFSNRLEQVCISINSGLIGIPPVCP